LPQSFPPRREEYSEEPFSTWGNDNRKEKRKKGEIYPPLLLFSWCKIITEDWLGRFLPRRRVTMKIPKSILAGVSFLGLLLFLIPGDGVENRDPGKESPGWAVSRAHAQAPPSALSVKEETPAEVEISAEKQQRFGVKKVPVSHRAIGKTIRAVARVEWDEGKVVTVNSKVEGWIEKLNADYTGKHVRKGEPLAQFYSPELLATQLEYLNLIKWKKDKAHRFQRNLEFRWGDRYNTTGQMLTFDLEALGQVAHQKLKFWDITDEQIHRIEESGEPIRTFTLYSPATGYLVQKAAVQGRRFEPGEKLFDIVDLSSLWVLIEVYAYELPLVKVGQEVNIQVSQLPGMEFVSRIDYIYPFFTGETRTARVRCRVANPGGELKPQMFATAEIRADLGRRLAVPEDAVIDTGAKKVVYVEKREGVFEPRAVGLGVRGDGWIEVVKGLKEGEKVAASGNFLIDSEARLRGVVTE
jgi:Cu(I)/Ag(I) efflux system membrane fusion protein